MTRVSASESRWNALLDAAMKLAAAQIGSPKDLNWRDAEIFFRRAADRWAKYWRCRHCMKKAVPNKSLCEKHEKINQEHAQIRREANISRGLTSRGTEYKRAKGSPR